MSRESLRIANCSGFWGDRQNAARELLDTAEFDVLTGDWLAELTMLILTRQRARDPLKGFATSFVDLIADVLGDCLDRGVKIVANAGGTNPIGCATAVEAVAQRLGLRPRVGTVAGDDITGEAARLVAEGHLLDADTHAAMQLGNAPLLSAHAYLGGWGIAACLEAGADIVITGRTTDAALVVGPAAWAFDWKPDDWDYLAGAVVAGHIIECGGQATGGNFSFFEEIPGLEHVGFPIAELHPDGSSVITKAASSGGAVTVDTVTAQLLYEVAGPEYYNPDVTARLDSIELRAVGPNRVLVEAVQGQPPPAHLKVSMAFEGGYRNSMTMVLTGLDAEKKAAAAEAALWAQIKGGRNAFEDVDVSLIGRPTDDPSDFGAAAASLRVAVAGTDKEAVGRQFSSAVIQIGLSAYPGFFTTSPPTDASPFARYRPGLVAADAILPEAFVEGVPMEIASPLRAAAPLPTLVTAKSPSAGTPCTPFVGPDANGSIAIALGRICGARSGDKGGDANVGVWARRDDEFAWLRDYLTIDRLRELVPGSMPIRIERYVFPMLRAINFVLHRWLGDGVASSLRFDGQAKGLAEFLRARTVHVPASLLRSQDGAADAL